MGRPARHFNYYTDSFFEQPAMLRVLDLYSCSGVGIEALKSYSNIQVLGIDNKAVSFYPLHLCKRIYTT